MHISLYGLAFAAFLLIGAIVTRAVLVRVLAKADEGDALTLDAARLAEKRRARDFVIKIVNAEIFVLPVIGYAIGYFFLDAR